MTFSLRPLESFFAASQQRFLVRDSPFDNPLSGLLDISHMEFVMSSLDLGQSIAAQKAGLKAMFGILNNAFESIEKLTSLNLQAFKSTLSITHEIAVSAKDPDESFALQAGQVQPTFDKTQSYWRHVYEIISSALADFAETRETQFKRHRYDWQAFVENLAKNATAGSEAAVSAWNSPIETASATFEAARKAAKQAGQIVESNVSATPDAATRSTRLGIEQAEAVEKE
ncbi:phasin family protein [Paraburkholderia hospita]|uniref:phasin family protein n=1 Tax=Paraburkholderia hospita TaxID=169430 RepID=UPI003F4FCEF4